MTTRLLLAAALVTLALLWAVPSGAQTTSTSTSSTTTTVSTSTSTTTSTLSPNVTCVNISDQPLVAGYHVTGYVTGAAAYSTNGMGFPNGGATLKAAGACLCHSRMRKPLLVIFGTGSSGNEYAYDPQNYKILAFTASVQVAPGVNLSQTVTPFFSVCQ